MHAQRLQRTVLQGGSAGPDLLVVHAQLVHGQPLLVLHLLIQPFILVAQLLLVLPVRSEAVLSNVVHLVRAELHLHGELALTIDGLVQALVAIRLALAPDVVLGAAGHGAVELLHNAEGHVAVVLVGHHHPQRCHVVHLVQAGFPAAAHLLPDAVQVLGAAADVLVLHAARIQACLDARDGGLEGFGVLALGYLLTECSVLFRVDDRKGEVLQVGLQAPDAQAVGHNREYVQRLLRQADLPLPGEGTAGAHVMHAACELDEHSFHILHGQQHPSPLLFIELVPVVAEHTADLADGSDPVYQLHDAGGHELLHLALQG
mmetsp:Transcript_9692/g.26233  ORF Transcript_9692/g.26233 Transcript_9692/m.26233 type:complete len:317 (+) Transcript_9692:2605-3555(+)